MIRITIIFLALLIATVPFGGFDTSTHHGTTPYAGTGVVLVVFAVLVGLVWLLTTASDKRAERRRDAEGAERRQREGEKP